MSARRMRPCTNVTQRKLRYLLREDVNAEDPAGEEAKTEGDGGAFLLLSDDKSKGTI